MGRLVEVDEEQLRAAHRLQQTVATLLADPATKVKIQEAVKMKWPQAQTPELDAHKAATDRSSGLAKELDDFKREVVNTRVQEFEQARLQRLNSDFEDGFTRLRRERGYTDAGLAAIRKIMEDKGTLDHQMAADHWEKQNPPQNPVMPNGSGAWNFMPDLNAADADADLKSMIASKGNNEALADKMAHDALNEHRNSRR